jgi:hypothetical protein
MTDVMPEQAVDLDAVHDRETAARSVTPCGRSTTARQPGPSRVMGTG